MAGLLMRISGPWATTLRVIAFAMTGALVALAAGLVWVALAPDDGFADLAAASVTLVALVPLGTIAGGVIGWRTGR